MFRKFSAAIIMLMLFSAPSWADIVYATSDGLLGSIRVTSSSDIGEPSVEYNSGINDPYIASYWNGTRTNIVMLEANRTLSGDRAYLFNPSNLSGVEASKDINGVHGAKTSSYAYTGRSLFMGAGSVIYEVETTDFSVRNSYDCKRIISRDNYDTEIVTVMAEYNTINAIAKASDDRVYIRFDGQMKEGVPRFLSADVSADASCLFMRTQNDILFLGQQEGLSALDDNNDFVLVLSTDAPVKAFCEDDNDSFYYATRKTSGSNYIFTVTSIKNTDQSVKFEPVELTSAYPDFKMVRDRDQNVLAVMTGEEIRLFDMKTGYFLRAFSVSELEGRPVGIVASVVYGYDRDSGSSGCNFSGAGIIMAALLCALLKKK